MQETGPPLILYWLLGAAAVIAIGLLLAWEFLALAVLIVGSVLGFFVGLKIGHRDGTKMCLATLRESELFKK